MFVGAGMSSSQGKQVVLKECLSDTDEPSLESRVAVNVMAVAWIRFMTSDDGMSLA